MSSVATTASAKPAAVVRARVGEIARALSAVVRMLSYEDCGVRVSGSNLNP